MMRVLCMVAVLALATTAFAGSDMTPVQAMEKTMNCPVCSAWSIEPIAGQSIRYDMFETKDGYLSVFMASDEKVTPQFDKCAAECKRRMDAIPTMTAEEKAKLCPFCTGQVSLSARKDVTMDVHKTHQGWVTLASSTTPEGVKALHEYAATAQKHSALMEQAAREMHGKEMKAKM